MIRETKQRIVRTIETEVHDREDSLPFSRNQRNGSDRKEMESQSRRNVIKGGKQRLSNTSPDDLATYLNRREEREWNRLSTPTKKRFLMKGMSSEKRKKKGEELQRYSWERRKQNKKITSKVATSSEGTNKSKRQNRTESKQREPAFTGENSFRFKRGLGNDQGVAVPQNLESVGEISGEGLKAAASGAESVHPAGIAVKTARKTADAFRQYLNQLNEAVQESVARQQEQIGKDNVVEEGIRGSVRTLTMAVMSMATVGLSMFLNALASLVAMLTSSFIVLFGAVVIVCAVAVILFSTIAGTESRPAAGQGLPSFITEDMMQAFFETQKESGVPVSTGIAQLIAESGFGMYGPGGESGQGMSSLAYLYKNLFGIKYFSGDQYASGSVDMATGEETEGGGVINGIGSFAKYPDYASCIKQRAWMLERDPYASFVDPYRNKNDGKYTKEAAQGYMQGIRLAGWATSSSYIEACIGHMDTYNLYRFDNMTYEEYKKAGSGSYDGVETDLMKRIAAIARENQGLYPCEPDMCAAWVTGVYQAAEAPEIPWGNGIDMWNTYQNTGNTSMENIPPGAVVCGSGSGPMGELYGHVGIYIGNGLVANNVGRFSIETVEEWASWQTATCQGHTGWIGWVYPGGVPTK